MIPTLPLFLVILCEGYVVLAAEILAIRQITPFVGNGTDTVAIIIAAVLMPLAVGYYFGGQYLPSRGPSGRGRRRSIRKKLLRNIAVAGCFLLPGLSYITVHIFFTTLIQSGITNRLIMTSLYSLLFLVIPVFLLGQTIPLVSNYFKKEHLARITGKILFFSTVGSFLGAIFTTLVLMSYVGVNFTVMFVFTLLTLLAVTLGRSLLDPAVKPLYVMLVLAVLINAPSVMNSLKMVKANQYHNIQVSTTAEGRRDFTLNLNRSSSIGPHGELHNYITFIEQLFIEPLFAKTDSKAPPKKILVIGAGGFTLGMNDPLNDYTYIDIDPDLQEAAETYFLGRPLDENQKFIATPARAFLTQTNTLYDLIVLDAYSGASSIPEHLVTKEFFQQVKDHLAPGGNLAANFITSPTFSTRFSRHIDNTLRAVFPYITRHLAGKVNGWQRDERSSNMVYLYHHPLDQGGMSDSQTVYSDNKNRAYLDRPQQLKAEKYLQPERQ